MQLRFFLLPPVSLRLLLTLPLFYFALGFMTPFFESLRRHGDILHLLLPAKKGAGYEIMRGFFHFLRALNISFFFLLKIGVD